MVAVEKSSDLDVTLMPLIEALARSNTSGDCPSYSTKLVETGLDLGKSEIYLRVLHFQCTEACTKPGFLIVQFVEDNLFTRSR